MLPKKVLLFTLLSFCLLNLNAQEKYNIKLGIEAGFPPFLEDSENLAMLFNVEPKIKVFDNAFLGLRVGITANTQKIKPADTYQLSINDKGNRPDNGVISVVPTLDYIFSEKKFRPFLGVGVGAYLMATKIEVVQTFMVNPSENVFDASVNKQIGVLLRGGIELGKLRVGLEYNFVPKTDIEISNGDKVGTIDKSYLGLSAGLIIGLGKGLK